MNKPDNHDATTDLPSASAGSSGVPDPLCTTDLPPGASPDGEPPPGAGVAESAFPVVPGYRVLREIARGGMGRVLAASDLTLDRDVAIKVLLPRANPERFVRESKITARLPHPGVPPVYALGTLADGSPFLAMKLVAGRTLTEEMETADRPRLVQAFLQVCQAVGFAHSRSIIHRDLKPDNVMVGAFGEVQVMDWGLAKDLAAPELVEELPASPYEVVEDDEQTIDRSRPGESTAERTQAGQVMGTPAYMAPEQARGEEVGTRADVFALGGILCAILTGRPPFGGKSTMEVIRRAAAGDLTAAFARLEDCEADEELVALCRRCLSPDAADRPENGQAVADELTGYLGGVQEKLRKAELAKAAARAKAREEAKRRRLALRLGGAVVLALVVGIVGTGIGLVRANAAADKERAANEAAQTAKTAAENAAKAEEEAKIAAQNAAKAEEAAKVKAQESATAEKAANEKTQKRLAQIEKGVQLLAGLLAGINPEAEKLGAEPLYVQLRKKVEQAADELDAEAVGDPLAVARLQTTLGHTLCELGNSAKAVTLLEKARATRGRELPADHLDNLVTLNALAMAYREAGRLTEAIPLFEQAHNGLAKTQGADHPDTLGARSNLALTYVDLGKLSQGIALQEQIRDAYVKKLGAEHTTTLTTVNNLASTYVLTGRTTEAIALLEQVRDAHVRKDGADHQHTLRTLNNLARAYETGGKLPEAIALFEQVRDALAKKLGADHPNTLVALNNLAHAYLLAKRFPEAIALHEKARDGLVKTQGADHPDTLKTLNNLGWAYTDAGKPLEGLALLKQVHDTRAKKLGPNHRETLSARHQVAAAYQHMGKATEANATLEEVRDGQIKALGADHPDTLVTLNDLGQGYVTTRKLPQAIAILEKVRDARVKNLGADHPDTLMTLGSLATAYRAVGRLPEAIAILEQVRDAEVKKFGVDHEDTLITLSNLGTTYGEVGRVPEAVAILEQVREAQVKILGADHRRLLPTLNNLAGAYRKIGKLREALPLYEQAVTILAKRQFQDEDPALVMRNAIGAHEEAGVFEKAEAWRRQWMAIVKEVEGADSAAYAEELALLGANLMRQAKWADAEPLLQQAQTIQVKKLGANHPHTFINRQNLEVVRPLAAADNKYLVKLREFGPNDTGTLLARRDLAQFCMRANQLDAAELILSDVLWRMRDRKPDDPIVVFTNRLLSQCLAARQGTAPNAWATFNTMSLLGGALLGQKKHGEAEPLLLKGYEGMKAREKTIPAGRDPIPEALDRLIELYNATDKPDEVKKWRAERAKYPNFAPPPREKK